MLAYFVAQQYGSLEPTGAVFRSSLGLLSAFQVYKGSVKKITTEIQALYSCFSGQRDSSDEFQLPTH